MPMLESRNQEYQLDDVLAFGRRAWRWLGGFAFVGAAAASVYLLFSPPSYQAMGKIEPAKYAIFDSYPNLGDLRYVEEPKAIAEYIKAPGFFDDATSEKCGLALGDDREQISRRITTSVVKGQPAYATVSVRAPSKDVAQECVAAIFRKLEPAQLAKLGQWDAMMASKLAQLESELSSKRAAIERITTVTGVVVIPLVSYKDSRFQHIKTEKGSVVIYLDPDAEGRELTEKIAAVKYYAETRKAREASLIGAEISYVRTSSSAWRMVLGALVLGSIVGGFLFVALEKLSQWRNART